MTPRNEREGAKAGRGRQKGAKSHDISPGTRAALLARSGGYCEAGFKGCAGRGDQAHHKKFRGRGGSNDLINLAWVCHRCHDATHRHQSGTESMRTPSWATEGTHEMEKLP